MTEFNDRDIAELNNQAIAEFRANRGHVGSFGGNLVLLLDAIAAGRGVGTTAEATAHHHPRPGVTYRPIKDGPRIAVRLLWWRDQRPAGLRHLIDAATTLYATP